MTNHSSGSRKTVTAACLLFLSAFLAEAAQAQRAGDRPRADPHQAVIDLGMRDLQVRSLEIAKEARAATMVTASPAVIKQVVEDFGRIQEINVRIMRSYSAGEAADYQYLSEAMGEINKRAARLDSNLLLPKSTNREALQPADYSPLIQLNDLIQHFVTNAIFRNPETIDAELGVTARRDIEDIVELSDRIRKSAERLQKSGGKVK